MIARSRRRFAPRFPVGTLVHVRTATIDSFVARVTVVEEPPSYPLRRLVVRREDGAEYRLTDAQVEHEVSLACDACHGPTDDAGACCDRAS